MAQANAHATRVNVVKVESIMGSLTKELYAYLGARKKWWLLPIMLILVMFGGLLILAQGSAVAPFIYTIF